MFDQGGVEALFLHEQGIPFEVVPGVPSAIGVPAYAGIPVTYPGGGDTLTFVRGFEDEGRGTPEVDWAALAKLDGTIVLYAGPRQLMPIVTRSCQRPPLRRNRGAGLERHAPDPADPHRHAAASSPTGFHERDAAGPSMLVVGKVVGLREHLRWFDARPLFGAACWSPGRASSPLRSSSSSSRTAPKPIEAPLINIVPPDDFGPLDEACARAGGLRLDRLHERQRGVGLHGAPADRPRDVRALAGARAVRRRPGHGVAPDALRPEGRSDPRGSSRRGRRRGAEGNRIAQGQARAVCEGRHRARHAARGAAGGGAEVTEVVAYRTVTAEGDAHLGIYRQLLDRQIDAVTFSSASAVRAFVSIYGADQAVDLLNHTIVATIGPVTADAAVRYGITPQITPASSDDPGAGRCAGRALPRRRGPHDGAR